MSETLVFEQPADSILPKRPRKGKDVLQTITEIEPVRIEWLEVMIEGIQPLVLHRFVQKSMAMMQAKMLLTEEEQMQKRSGKKVRPPRDFEADFKAATYRAQDGWAGLPCRHIRSATIAAAQTTRNIAMAPMKRAIFVKPQGYDVLESDIPLVRLSTEPVMHVGPARNSGIGKSMDLRSRPMWNEWAAEFAFEFDADAISADALHNLLIRAGNFIGIGEGRPNSRMCNGCDWGRFAVRRAEHVKVEPVTTKQQKNGGRKK